MFEVAIIIAVLTGLVELVKKLNVIPVRFLPALSLLLGIIAGIFYVDVQGLENQILFGVMIGLSANGLFDQSKIITKKQGVK